MAIGEKGYFMHLNVRVMNNVKIQSVTRLKQVKLC